MFIMPENRKLFKRTDLLLIIILITVAIISFAIYNLFYSGTGMVCEISFEGSIVKTVDLSKSNVFFMDQKPNVLFEVKDGRIAFIESDCPDKVCINSGFLGHNGQMAACLPNRLSIRVLSKSNDISPDEPDVIAN